MRYFNKAMLVASAALCLNLSVFSHLSSTYKCNFLGADNKQ